MDTKTGKKKTAHNRDKDYDCYRPEADDSSASSLHWLGNDTIFAPLDGSLWAVAVNWPNRDENVGSILTVDTKTGKVKQRKDLPVDAIAKLPDCAAK